MVIKKNAKRTAHIDYAYYYIKLFGIRLKIIMKASFFQRCGLSSKD